MRPIRAICAALEERYGSPRLGNKSNPLDELVYIILSTRTREAAYRAAYASLKHAYPSWSAITASELPSLTSLLKPYGLGAVKARSLVTIIEQLTARFGRATLAPLRHMSDAEAEAFLLTLRGVSLKVAKCVLMYSLGRDVLPVDVHVHRIAARLGLIVKKRPATSQALIEDAVPAKLRYGFHVNCIAHGRRVCLPRAPKCEHCCIAQHCGYYRREKGLLD